MDASVHDLAVLTRLDSGFQELVAQIADLKASLLAGPDQSLAAVRGDIQRLREELRHGLALKPEMAAPLPAEAPCSGPTSVQPPTRLLRATSAASIAASRTDASSVSSSAFLASSTGSVAASGQQSATNERAGLASIGRPGGALAMVKSPTGASLRDGVGRVGSLSSARGQSRLPEPDFTFPTREVWDLDEATMNNMRSGTDSKVRKVQGANRGGAGAWGLFVLNSLTDRYQEEMMKSCMLHPMSKVKLLWDVIGMLLLCYDLAIIPMQAFVVPEDIGFQVLNWISRVYWSADVILSFSTGFYDNGQLQMSHRKVALSYLKSWFVLDMVIILPEWIMVIAEGGGEDDGFVHSLGALRSLRGARFLRLLRLAKVQQMISDLQARINSTVAQLVLSILKLVVALIVLIHFFACAWYWVGNLEEERGWVSVSGMDREPFSSRYILCFQWSLRQFHPGKVEKRLANAEGTDTERTFEIISALTGLAVASTFISSITNTMAQLQRVREERTRHLRVVAEYARAYAISNELCMRAKKYVKHRLEYVLRSTYEAELLQLLPMNMLMDMHFEARGPLLGGHRYFGELRAEYPTTMRRVCHTAVIERTVSVTNNAFTIGTPCSHMFFVFSGECRYLRGAYDEPITAESGISAASELENSSQVLVRFRRARNACLSSCAACCSRKNDDEEPEESADSGNALHKGQWLSEAVLWTSTWEHRGTLHADSDCQFMLVGAAELIGVVRESPRAWVDAAVYAKSFLQKLRANEYMRTDLIQIMQWEEEKERRMNRNFLTFNAWRNPMGTPTQSFATVSRPRSPGGPSAQPMASETAEGGHYTLSLTAAHLASLQLEEGHGSGMADAVVEEKSVTYAI